MLSDLSHSAHAPSAEEFCKLFREKNSIPKFVYGINQYAASIAERCDISGFIDDFRQEHEYMGKPVLRLHDVPEGSLIVSAIVGIIPLTAKKRLQDAGLRHLDYFAFLKYSGLELKRDFLFDFEDFKKDFEENRDKYERIYGILKDEESKDTFSRIINFRLSYDLSYMEVFKDRRSEQYFEEFLGLSDEEVFVDAGGFDGETTIAFIKRYPAYKAIYFFEPDIENLSLAKEKLRGCRDIYFFNVGLYNRTGYLRFSCSKDAGKISDTGDVDIFVDKMDNVILEFPPTFIKIDIEGAEKEALEGARDIIKKYMPKLAIAAYHRADDLRAIPEKVLSIADTYSLYIRHYTEGFTETVFYFK
jgi:FkbM family methyltransferase